MKKALLILLFPLLSIGQTQIGGDIDGEAINDGSGRSISLSSDGSTIAIGAPANTGSGNGIGSVRVLKNVSGTWTQIGAKINGDGAYNYYGSSVSLSSDGNILAIGALSWDTNGAGLVRVYQNISNTWTQIGADINGKNSGDLSGSSISLSSDGSILAIGAYLSDENGVSAGSVRIYQNVFGSWIQIGTDIYGESAVSQSGISVSLSSNGSVLAIGAQRNNGSATESGSVRVYKNILGIWTQLGADIDGEAAYDWSGRSVSLSSDGSILAIGAAYNQGNGTESGSVRVYKNISGSWTKIGNDIDGKAAGDFSGYSVSISSDGSILAIGAPAINMNGAGSVRVYKNISGTWTKIGVDIVGEAADDNSGVSVSLSSDGSILAIGADGNDGSGIDSGSVRVYNLSAVLSSDSFVLANFSVYPNPASELVTISFQEDQTLEKVNIYNTLGQLVKTENKNVIRVNSLTKGSYYFEIITNKGKATKTIIVQ